MRIFLLVPVLAVLAGLALADHPDSASLIPGPNAKPCRTIWPPEPSCAGGPGYTLPKVPWDKPPFTGSLPQVLLNPKHPGGPLLERQPEYVTPDRAAGFLRLPVR